jgi:hypothetical protein
MNVNIKHGSRMRNVIQHGTWNPKNLSSWKILIKDEDNYFGSVTFCLVQVRLVQVRLVHFRLVQVRLDNILPR